MTIVVAGHTGLVGSAIFELLRDRGDDVLGVNRSVVDLLDRVKTFEFLQDVKPKVVIDSAAVVGGIGANNTYPVEFLSRNLHIQSNLMDAAHKADVERFVFLGSSCIYPKESPQPIKEEYLMTGPLESTNSAYAVAKIAGIELIKSYRKQYQRRWISLMPTNVYGPRDNFNLENSHVLPALINRFVSAKSGGDSRVVLWGTGKPRREFLHSYDLASATLLALEKYDESEHLNVGTGVDMSVLELAQLIANESGFDGEIVWDSTKPDGTPRKVLDVSRLRALGWSPSIEITKGVRDTIAWFRENRSKVRV